MIHIVPPPVAPPGPALASDPDPTQQRKPRLPPPENYSAQSTKDLSIGRHCLKHTAPRRCSPAAKDPCGDPSAQSML
ncbi:hypothetical protein Q8A67_024285 [Cirrhinus molitorella]|uniref:Uncharacterized protein n=1 Tax=Cirrhinus molitorella TaxID=172907 RepID=A0AA88P374_9TELE|nr:hypothetical protein Q8A67_024285 [Cirrhinus molitorella]